jgi:RsiW-degrading membrane proteinase PrsW (M82 family)
MTSVLRLASVALVALSLLVAGIAAPRATWLELQFVALVIGATLATRSMGARYAVSSLALGLGATTTLIVGAGHAATAVGIDTTDGIGNWGMIPLLEEAVKLAPVAVIAWLYARRRRFRPNPSDLLMLGCAAGAGFAIVENYQLVLNSSGIARDMARQYGPHLGPIYLVPAWGSAGYVGHAAATGMICAGYGLGLELRARGRTWWAAVPAACGAWIVVEHMLVNLYVGTGSDAALMLGNGRLTPWLFVAVAAAVVGFDIARHRDTLARSATLRRRVAMARAALLRALPGARPPVPKSRVAAVRLFLSQLRDVNLTAWYIRDKTPVAVNMETV